MTPRDTVEDPAPFLDDETGELASPPEPATLEPSREAEELRARWMRAVADMDNLRKRARREAEAARRLERKELLGDVLAVLDNLDRALAAPGAAESPLHAGIVGVRAQVHEVLARRGARALVSDGEAFDPRWHDAVAVECDESAEDGVVLRTLAAGFVMDDEEMLRPAAVVVNRLG
jgi:molecular chaperone GrpE